MSSPVQVRLFHGIAGAMYHCSVARLRKDVRNIAQCIVEHESQQTHLCRTSIVQFDGALLLLPVIALLIPTEIKESITEVSRELSLACLVSVGNFHEDPSGDHLSENAFRERAPGCKTIRHILHSRETHSSLCGKVSYNTEHANTSVLDFECTKTFEFITALFQVARRIPHAKRSHYANFISILYLRRRESGVNLALLGRRKGGCSSNSRNEESNLHHGTVLDR
mmetsp:Transcript_33074/g.80023  ORF Transcript_33074/g.80023 Transcript_33074/m.80023 type:complete len:224 (+) Transcript_33074:502-1173(+)